MERKETVRKAKALVEKAMKGNDASRDAAYVWRVRDLALSLASEEGLSSDPDSMEIVELAALLHDIGDHKYLRDPSEEKAVENFLTEEGVEENKKSKILKIVNGMGKCSHSTRNVYHGACGLEASSMIHDVKP
ncbi:Metal-dependent phosphohydrolase [Trifolium repens]|nr:Metal-dependent phosphohydrolase [Trifolium repens]